MSNPMRLVRRLISGLVILILTAQLSSANNGKNAVGSNDYYKKAYLRFQVSLAGNWQKALSFCENGDDVGALASALSSFPNPFLPVAGPGDPTCVNSDEIGGLIYSDYDADGTKDAYEHTVYGITVTLFDDDGQVAVQSTGDDGKFLFSGLDPADTYRIEFDYPDWFFDGAEGSASHSDVQIATPGTCNYNIGIFKPYKYCGEADPTVALTCFTEGAFNGPNDTEPALVGFPYSADGHDFSGTTPTGNFEVDKYAEHQDIGATYGLAWQATQQRLYVGAFHKRYVGYGPAGPDAIYQFDQNGAYQGTINLDDVLGSTSTAGADVHDFNGTEIMDIGVGNSSFDGVGKRAFGDLEMSGDGKTLYIVNLFDRKIYALDVEDGVAANATVVNSWTCPDPSGAGRHRPFALAWHNDKLWLGTVDENADSAWVHSLDPAGTTFSQEFVMDLIFTRQAVLGNANNAATKADWRDWVSNPATMTYGASGVEIFYPQPILTDIEFDGENMNLGFRDRFGDQTGMRKYFNKADSLANKFTFGTTAGDIVRVCKVNGDFVLESGGTGSCSQTNGLTNSGPNSREFFFWDIYHTGNTWNTGSNTGGFHWETAQGALLQIGGEQSVMTTVMDPFNDFSGGVAKFVNATGFRQGLGTSSPVGSLVGGYTVFESGNYSGGYPPNNGTFAKANGLGDIEAFCISAPIEIGNLIWSDLDGDGVQDPSEPGIDGVEVKLVKNGSVIATATSAGGGKFGFSSAASGASSGYVYNVAQLLPEMDYEIQVQSVSSQTVLAGLALTLTNNGGGDAQADLRDNDASNQGSHAVIAFTTGKAGENVHYFDFGFQTASPPYLGMDQSICTGTSLSLVAYSDNTQIDSIPGEWEIGLQTGSTATPSSASGDSLFTVVFSNTTNANVVDTVVFTAENGLSDTLLITVKPNVFTTINDGVCSGLSYHFGGEELFLAGTYHDTLSAANGCDSIVNLNLSIYPTYLIASSATICQGENYSFQGHTYSASGVYLDTFPTVHGCDSIFQLSLSVLPISTGFISETICEGDSYSFNGEDLTVAGSYLDTLEADNGCDSILELTLSVNPNVETTINATICPGEVYFFNGSNLSGDGTFYDTLAAANGCDSTLTLHLVTLPHSYKTIQISICEDETYLFNGQMLNSTGTYLDTLAASNGCDSFLTLQLTVLPVPTNVLTENICAGDSYLFDGQTLTTAGSYMATLTAANGCDSLVELQLSVLPNPTTQVNESICAGESYLFNGQTLTTAGSYMATLTAANGCDSLVELQLTIDPLPMPMLSDVGICGNGLATLDPGAGFASYNWSNAMSTPTITVGEGSYTVTVTNGQGCSASASALVTDLGAYMITLNESICNGEFYFFDGENKTLAGTYIANYMASNGCDSTVTLNLSVLPNSAATIEADICNGESYQIGNQSFTASGTYEVLLTAANGCDSVVTLNLTALPNTAAVVDIEICHDESYLFDGQELTTTGSYFAQMTSANGCDSLVTLNLTVLPVISATINEEICLGETYLFNGQAIGTAGSYLDTLTSFNGCDSFLTLNLSVNIACNPVFDLALRKTLATGQLDSVEVGDTVTFTITVFNQGNLPAHNILIIDYLPEGLTFLENGLNSDWTDFGAGPSWLYNSSPLQPGEMISQNIKLQVNNLAGLGSVDNYAEITNADDDPNGNNTHTDIDSNPNAYNLDDAGGDPGTPADDVITGNGTGAPNSNDPLTDEDDHDGAAIVVFEPAVSLGNLVFYDYDNDGYFNNNDEGVEGVQVLLFNLGMDNQYNTSDDMAIDTLWTDANGHYLFTGLDEMVYYVKLNGMGIPAGYISSTGDGPLDLDGTGAFEPTAGTDLNVNNDDDGTQVGAMVISDTIRLTLGGEPGGDVNTTVDFGLYKPHSLKLGNLVFLDFDNDGNFNNNDQGIEDVEVVLYDAGPDGLKGTNDDLAIDSILTNGFGEYLFTELYEGLFYIKLNGNGIPADHISSTGGGIYDIDGAGGYEPAIGTDNNEDHVDDGTQMGSMIMSDTIRLTYDGEPGGDDNLTVDFGLYDPQPIPTLSLGNTVFVDHDNDGIYNNISVGVEDVEVILYSVGTDGLKGTGDDVALDSMLTDGFGEYLFTGLAEGVYYVKLSGEGIPPGYISSTGGGPYDNDGSGTYEPYFGTNNNEDGSDDGTQMGSMIMSDTIRLTIFAEPNVHNNYTVDFGLFSPQPEPILSLGNLVFHDADNDGIFNNEFGIEDIAIELYNVGGDNEKGTGDDQLVSSQLTNGFGEYLFTGLIEGLYYVKLTGEGIPNGFVSSTGDGIYDMDGAGFYEPYFGTNDDENNTDDGSQMGSMIMSDTIRLSINGEPGGSENLTVDFGLYEPQMLPTLSLGNQVFVDNDNDGIFNNNDAGIEGVEVVLYDAGPDGLKGTADDEALDSMLTTNQGQYLFTGLAEGLYFVKLNGTGIPANHVSSTGDGVYDLDGAGIYEPYVGTDGNDDSSDDGTQMGSMIMSDTIRLTIGGEPSGNENLTLDFGLYEPQSPYATIGNYVWYDFNHNGQQDGNESGVEGMFVQLFDLGPNNMVGGSDDVLVDQDTTDQDGFYLFENILPNSYYLQLVSAFLPANYNPTIQNVGDDTTDSDADGTGMTQVVVLSPGEVNLTLDFGIEPDLASLGNYVWNDENQNGQQDGGENGVAGILVKLYDLGQDGIKGGGDDQLLEQQPTDGDGLYNFDNLEPGSYYVQFDLNTLPTGFYPSLQNATGNDGNDSDANTMGMTDVVILVAGEMDTTLDFGIYLPMFDLALYKTLSPNQSNAVNIHDDVKYTIKVINEGTTAAYNIDVYDHIPNGLVLSPNDVLWTLANDSTATYQYAGPLHAGDSFSIEIILQVQYGASGQSMTNVAEVESAEDASGIVVTDVDSTPNNGDEGEDDQDDQPIELLPHDPTGWIYCDKTGEIISGGTISVTGPNGIVNDQVFIVHDGTSGYYEFYTDGTPGIYTLAYTHPDGYPMSATCLPQPSTLDPTGLADPLVLGANAIGNVLADTACASNPYYTSFDLELGDPIVLQNNLPVQCIFIGSIVCEDVDLNDNADGTEPGMANVTVNLYNCADTLNPINTTVTDAQGRYRFSDLLPGDYRVQFVSPSDFRYILNGNVSADGYADCVTLAWGECDTTISTCMIACPSVDAGADATICQGDATQLQAVASHGPGSFSWNPATALNNANIANPLANPIATTDYTVSLDDGLGCPVATDEVTVFVTSSNPIITYTPFDDTTIYCTDAVPFDPPTFVDPCDTMLNVTLDSVVVIGCNGSIVRTWTATNGGGNSVAFVQTVNYLDTVPPVMVAIHPIFGVLTHGDTLYADCNQVASFDSTGFSSFDECCPAPTITFAETVTPGDCDVDGYIQLMYCGWTSTDCCGNVDSLFFTVIVSDNSAPVLSAVPADLTTSCGAIPPAPGVTATDNCDATVAVVFDETTYVSLAGCDSLLVRTWSATDSCGNATSAVQNINIFDNTPPTMTANHFLFGNISHRDTFYAVCSQIPLLDSINFSAADDCCGPTVNFDESSISGNCASDGFVELRNYAWIVNDCCGNTDSLFFTIIVNDTVAPVISGVPANTTATCNTVPPVPGVSTSDDCYAAVSLGFNQSIIPALSGCDSLIIRTWTATDSCGNVSTASQQIMVNDTVPPTMVANHVFFGNINHGDTLYADCSQMPSLDSIGFAAFDDCCATTITFDEIKIPGNCATDGFLELRYCGWTATDCCGNTDSLFFTVIITDTQQPSLVNIPANTTASCDNIPLPALVTATDDCDTLVNVVLNENTVFDNSTGGCQILTRTWTATDDCGNTSLGTQQITLLDTVDPDLVAAPADTTVSCLADVPAAASLSASDNCDASVQVNLVETNSGNPSDCNYQITRTWTATDDCGNTDVEVQVITVNDTVPPVISPAPATLGINCSDPIPAPATLTATDNCDADVTITVVDTYIGDTATACYLITRTWTATDECGNIDNASQLIMVFDFTPPTLHNVPATTTANCDSLPSYNVTATDNCDGDVPVIVTETITSLPNGCVTDIVRTFTATDDCNNIAFATQHIFITNSNAPVITLTNPQLAGLGDGDTLFMECNGLVSMGANDATASSDCCPNTDIQFKEYVVAAGDCMSQGYMQMMRCGWVATDCCGNVDSLFLIVVVSDFSSPVLYGIPADLTISCGDVVPPPANVVAVDNCDNHVELFFDQNTIAIAIGSQITRTWSGVDNCGNFISDSQIITVLNDEAPILQNVPADLTLIYPSPVPSPANVTALDDCDVNPQVVLSEAIVGNGCCYTLTRTWTVTDYYGNAVSDSQVITMVDNVQPVLVGIPANQTYDCAVSNVPLPAVTATDNCTSSPIISFVADTIQLACGYEITRTWIATDDCGNASTGSTTLTFLDTTDPVLVGVPADITLACNEAIPAPPTVTATDNCDGNPGVAFNQTQSGVGCIYTITRTWTALDDCGNGFSASQIITVNNDLVLPQFIGLPSDITVNCSDVPPPANVTASDNCDVNVTVSMSEAMNNDCPFTITRTWVATDDCGNSITGSQLITLVDNVSPSISNVPGNITVECDEIPPVPNDVTASDNCDGAPVLSFAETSAGTLCDYVITRTWTAEDNCGNSIVASQLITVHDTENPVITVLPENDTLECIDDIPITPTVTATDNCDNNVLVTVQENYDVNDCLYTITRTWTATDNCGNTAQATQIIVYDDTTPPVLSDLPADTTVNCESIIAATFVTATDNCDTFVEVFLNEDTIGTGCNYTIRRTWAAIDDCSNITTHIQNITVTDTEAPVFEEPLDVSVDCGNVPTAVMPQVSENCDMALVFDFEENVIQLPCGYEIYRSWTATDDCGNVGSVDQIITVIDTVAPVLQFTHPMLLGLSSGDTLEVSCANPVSFGVDDAIANDNCGTPSLTKETLSTTLGNCMADGFISISREIWTATDSCGQQTQFVLFVKTVDNGPPVFTSVPADVTVLCGDPVPAFGTPSATDACFAVTMLTTTDSLPRSDGYELVRTWLAIDACGNSATVSQSIEVYLNGLPTLANVPNDTTTLISAGGQVPPAPMVTAMEGCTNNPLAVNFTQNIVAGATGCDTTIVRIWSATDGFGNTVADTQTILTIRELDVTFLVVPETCAGGDGSAALFPDSLDFAWSDGGTGAIRNDLAAGTYTVITSDGGCSDTLEVVIANECICIPALVDSITIAGATCGAGDGEATILLTGDVNDYTFIWTPDLGNANATGNARTELPAGHYLVAMMYQFNLDCIDTVEFDLGDDCFKCPDLSDVAALVAQDDGTSMACVPVPFGAMQGLDIQINGLDYTAGLQGCDNQSVIAYDYSTAYNGAQSGKFAVQWQHNGQVFHTLVNNMDELAAGMSQVDIAGHWKNDKKSYRLITTNLDGNYGQLTMQHIPTATVTQHGPQQSTAFMGTQMEVGLGENEVVMVNLLTGCNDAVTLTLEPALAPIFANTFEAVGGDCNQAPLGLCLDIPYAEASAYEFKLDGNPMATLAECGNSLYYSYETASLPPTGPYQLSEWTVDGQTFSGLFNTLPALVNMMNSWDPTGNWTMGNNLIQGGTNGLDYGKMVIHQGSNTLVIEPFTTTIAGNIYLEFAPGEHVFVAKRLADGFMDSLEIMAACVTTDQYQFTITVGETGTFCFDLAELPGNLSSIENACEEGPGAAALFDIKQADVCVDYIGEGEGISQGCFTLCDDYGICDTVMLSVNVELANSVDEANPVDGLTIYNAFSPNGDGVNDYFTIEGLQQFPGSKLSIFSRNGRKLFSVENYSNDWGGSWGSNHLPNGTYFYVLELKEGQNLKGFVQVER